MCFEFQPFGKMKSQNKAFLGECAFPSAEAAGKPNTVPGMQKALNYFE